MGWVREARQGRYRPFILNNPTPVCVSLASLSCTSLPLVTAAAAGVLRGKGQGSVCLHHDSPSTIPEPCWSFIDI
ncbi:hypothetical protein E2C01_040925 [Portunus trituberculatus]|uniref:Uncharacterized protein n=1 Tax=Portunus trituberculatus TaxID=210409 RepID=A0A5B7FQI9_PORTR|nr:hypothetical protein [Portunus trituberculatus]